MYILERVWSVLVVLLHHLENQILHSYAARCYSYTLACKYGAIQLGNKMRLEQTLPYLTLLVYLSRSYSAEYKIEIMVNLQFGYFLPVKSNSHQNPCVMSWLRITGHIEAIQSDTRTISTDCRIKTHLVLPHAHEGQ